MEILPMQKDWLEKSELSIWGSAKSGGDQMERNHWFSVIISILNLQSLFKKEEDYLYIKNMDLSHHLCRKRIRLNSDKSIEMGSSLLSTMKKTVKKTGSHLKYVRGRETVI